MMWWILGATWVVVGVGMAFAVSMVVDGVVKVSDIAPLIFVGILIGWFMVIVGGGIMYHAWVKRNDRVIWRRKDGT